jgi:hypothetical protein
VSGGRHEFQLVGLAQEYDPELVGAAGVGVSAERGKASEKIEATLAADRYDVRVSGHGGASDVRHPYRLNVNELGAS